MPCADRPTHDRVRRERRDLPRGVDAPRRHTEDDIMRRPPVPPSDDRSVPQPEPRDERMAALRGQQLLAELAARAEMARGDSPYYVDERVMGWLAREVSSSHRSGDGWSAAHVRSVATRLRARAEAARLKVR